MFPKNEYIRIYTLKNFENVSFLILFFFGNGWHNTTSFWIFMKRLNFDFEQCRRGYSDDGIRTQPLPNNFINQRLDVIIRIGTKLVFFMASKTFAGFMLFSSPEPKAHKVSL